MLTLLLLSTSVFAQDSVTYDLSQSDLTVRIYNDTTAWASRLGHDHAIVATQITGTAQWSKSGPLKCSVDFTVPVSDLVVDPPGVRAKFGLHGETSESDKKTITGNFRGESQLNMAQFPTISFHADTCTAKGDAFDVSGKMTLRGVSKAFVITLKVNATATDFSATGSTSLKTSDFGFQPFSALGGTLRNQDRLHFVIDAKGKVK